MISFNFLHPLNIPVMLTTVEELKLDKSKYFKCSQNWNIKSAKYRLLLLKFLIPLNSFNFLHQLSMPSIYIALEVLKLDKSKYSNSLHSENIPTIFVTLIVLILLISLISLISFNLNQFLNINDISVTLEVLKFDKSKYSNSKHASNIAYIIEVLTVLKFSIPFISFNLRQS